MRTRIAAAWCLLLLLTLGLAACGVPSESGAGAGLSQAALEASIRNDRKHLFDASLTYTPDISMSVGGRLTYAVVLTARGEKSSRRAAQAALETRVFRVGGWQGAGLSADGPDVKTVLHGSPQRQAIDAPGENAQWQWSVSADEPGDYDLALTVITYQGETNRALETLSPPIKVHLKVYNTWSHRFTSMRNWLYTAAGISGALIGVYALRAPLTELVQGRREARQRRDENRDEDRDGYM